ncbi:MAG: substrate-binding domain-containing protein [Lachnospiraceae bacterium]
MKKKILALVLACMMTASLTACEATQESTESTSDTSTSGKTAENIDKSMAADANNEDWEQALADKGYEQSGDESYDWVFICKDFTDVFTVKVMDAFEAYVKENYPNVNLSLYDGKMDAATQIQQAEDAVANEVDCIIASPSDSDGCASIVDIATEAGIPCVMVNTEVNNDKPYFFVGSDHLYSGQLQGEYIRDYIDDTETQKICYLEGTPGFNHTTLRKQGLFDVLDEAGYNYELLASLTGEYYRDKAISITEDWITQFGDEIDIIAAANDEMAMGALQAVKAAGLTDIKILGIDANEDAMEAISNDELCFTVFQNAAGQGEWGAVAAYAACNGMEPEVLSIPYEPVRKDNLSDYWTP